MYMTMHGTQNMVTTVMCEAQVEKAFIRPWVEQILRMAMKIRTYEAKMRDNGIRSKMKPRMKLETFAKLLGKIDGVGDK